MSYNRLTALAANVQALEAAVAIHMQRRQANAEEKETLSRYSGFGGIKDVLDLGTDKPLDKGVAEPLHRLQGALSTLAGGDDTAYRSFIESIKSSVLTAFYTPQFLIDAVAEQIHGTFRANGLQMRSFLEPSAGIGGFLPVAMPGTRSYAFEKDTITGLVLSLLHEDATTVTAGFETIDAQELEHRKFDVIASNIPFGNFRVFDADLWKKGGSYEQATKTIHNYFFVKAMERLSEGGLLAFVTSRGVADTAGNRFVREYLVNHADLVSAIRLPDALFMQTSGIEVGSDLLIFQKHTSKAALSAREQMFLQVGKEMYDMSGTMTENANRLFSMPKTVLATDSSIVMNQHGKYVRKHQWLGSDTSMAQYLSALLKHDFDRYFRKSLFGQRGEAPVQMSLFGIQETTALSVNRGRRPYTEKFEDWMKSGALVMFEGQIGTVVFRKSSHYDDVAVDFVPMNEGMVNVERAADYFPVREAYFRLSAKERNLQTEQAALRERLNTLYDYFRENGGETGFVHSKDIAEAEKEIKRYVAFRTGRIGELLKATQRSERAGIWLSYAARKSGMQAIGVALENASRIAENTSRLATFTTSLEQGKSLLTAIDDAKNVTVNFNRRGTATRPLGMFYVFFNASVQGAAQVARIAMRNRKRFAQAVAALTAAGFLDSLLLDFFLAGSGDDSRDLAVTEYERHNHLIIPGMGKRGYLKIPLPQGFRAFFGIGTALHDLYRGKLGSEDAARMMLTMLYEDFSPVASPSSKGDATRVLIPTALTPWYDIWYAGEDAFGYPVGRRSYSTTENYPLSEMGLRNVNKAIYYLCRGINRLGGGDENTPAGLRKNGEIDPLLRGIFEYNPSHVEHVLTYYSGGMGKFIKDMVHTSQALFTGEEISSRDLPVINRFYGTARPENPAERYYTLRDRLTNIEAKYKRMGPALDRTDPAVQRNLQRIAIFKAHQTAMNKLRAILADTRPNSAAYDRLQEELNETMMNALNEDDHVTEY